MITNREYETMEKAFQMEDKALKVLPNKVIMEHSDPDVTTTFTPTAARAFAQSLLDAADEAERDLYKVGNIWRNKNTGHIFVITEDRDYPVVMVNRSGTADTLGYKLGILTDDSGQERELIYMNKD